LRGPNLSFSGVEAGVGAAVGLGVAIGSVGDGVLGLAGAEVGRGGSVETGGKKALVGDGAGVRVGIGVCVAGAGGVGVGVGVFGAGMFGRGATPAALTVVEDPAGTETSTPFALVSTVPEIVTMVVSPLGETVTCESDPARITDAIPALRTS
jgi:hypothetical protein